MSPESDKKKAELDKVREQQALLKQKQEEERLAVEQQLANQPKLVDEEQEEGAKAENQATKHFQMVPYAHPKAKADMDVLEQAYRTLFKQEPIEREDGTRVLAFPTIDDAKTFFEQQAINKLVFMCAEEGKGYDGHNFFSCGDGDLYQGSLHLIASKLQEKIDAEPTNTKAVEGLDYINTLLPKLHLTQQFRGAIPRADNAAVDDTTEEASHRKQPSHKGK